MLAKRRTFLIPLAVAAAACIAASPVQAGLAPHKAVYDLLPGAVSGKTPYDGVEGLVTRSVERTCDGWIVAEHMVMRVLTRVGGVIDREIRFTSWEAADGTKYRFAATIKSKAGNEDKKLKGTLSVDHDGGAGTAVYSAPEGYKVTLPEGTYLPVGQIRKLLADAAAGKKQTQFHTFDGTEETGPELMSSVITKRLKPGEGKGMRTAWGPMGGGAGWRVSSAFFDTTGDPAKQQAQSTPSYQMDVEILDNGVPRLLEMDLGGFTVVQLLKTVEPLPEPKCK